MILTFSYIVFSHACKSCDPYDKSKYKPHVCTCNSPPKGLMGTSTTIILAFYRDGSRVSPFNIFVIAKYCLKQHKNLCLILEYGYTSFRYIARFLYPVASLYMCPLFGFCLATITCMQVL